MDLITAWFVLIAVLWTGYLVLEGFDFGVGMLLPVLGPGDGPQDTSERKRLMLTTIGPFWDGNEVWLLTAGGAMFAAFPGWYASMFSAMYLPFVLLLVALIMRNLGLEYRHKRTEQWWTRRWDWAIVGGSAAAPFLVGVALTNLVHGLPIDADHQFTGTVFTLLNPISLLGGFAVVALCLTHACFFLALKTEGPIRENARTLARRIGPVAALLGVALLLWLGIEHGTLTSWVASAVAAVALVFALVANAADREGQAFTGTAVCFIGITAAYFLMLWPDVIPSTLNPAWSLTATEAASSPGTLRIMSWATLIFLPVVLIYTAWSYWVFRQRLSVKQLTAAH